MILSDARSLVQEYLDAASDPRWDSANIDDALEGQMSLTLNEYTEGGGERLLEIVSVTTDSTGKVDLSAYDPMHIRSCAIVRNGRRYILGRTSAMERVDAAKADTLEVIMMRKWGVSTNALDPLIYSAAATANSWDAMEHLICIRAAIELAVKDEDTRKALKALEARYLRGVMSTTSAHGARPMPGRRRVRSPYTWAWLPGEQAIQMCLGRS